MRTLHRLIRKIMRVILDLILITWEYALQMFHKFTYNIIIIMQIRQTILNRNIFMQKNFKWGNYTLERLFIHIAIFLLLDFCVYFASSTSDCLRW